MPTGRDTYRDIYLPYLVRTFSADYFERYTNCSQLLYTNEIFKTPKVYLKSVNMSKQRTFLLGNRKRFNMAQCKNRAVTKVRHRFFLT